jgi:hypothetical protein
MHKPERYRKRYKNHPELIYTSQSATESAIKMPKSLIYSSQSAVTGAIQIRWLPPLILGRSQQLFLLRSKEWPSRAQVKLRHTPLIITEVKTAPPTHPEGGAYTVLIQDVLTARRYPLVHDARSTDSEVSLAKILCNKITILVSELFRFSKQL